MGKGRIIELASKLSLANLSKRNIPAFDNASEQELNFLEHILSEEQRLREKKRKDVLTVRSKLPEMKCLDDYDLSFQPSLSKWHITKLKETAWIEAIFNIIIVGEAGVGKTHIAVAIGHNAIQNQKKVFYATTKELLFLCNSKDILTKSRTRLKYIRECDLVIIDEFGYTPISKDEGLCLYNLINDINKVTSLVIVTNRVFSSWGSIFTDEVIAATLIDRITEKCQIIRLSGNSYRLAKHENIVKANSCKN